MAEDVVVTFLGTGDAFGSGGRLQTCFHVRSGPSAFLIDCGATACLALKRYELPAADIEAVVISHFHADHFAGLPFLLLEARIRGRTSPLLVAGPPDIERRVALAMESLFPGAGTRLPFLVSWLEFGDGPIEAGPLRITAWPVEHAPATRPHALRIEVADRVIAYSGDTEWSEVLIEVARGADLFICEVSGFDGPVGIHLDYSTLRAHRAAFECDRFVATHMGEDVLANAEVVAAGLRATLAHDGLVLRI